MIHYPVPCMCIYNNYTLSLHYCITDYFQRRNFCTTHMHATLNFEDLIFVHVHLLASQVNMQLCT